MSKKELVKPLQPLTFGSGLDAEGREVLSDRPVALPAGMKRPSSLNEDIQRIVRTTLSQQAAAMGEETFEESLDFGDDDDGEMETPYQFKADEVDARRELVESQEMARRLAELRGRRRAEQEAAREEAAAKAAPPPQRRGGSGPQRSGPGGRKMTVEQLEDANRLLRQKLAQLDPQVELD